MLVLTRKRGESIQIGDNIEVKVLDIKGNYISIGVNAPRDVSIFRTELINRPSQPEKSAQTLNARD
jgi:carbon storage regulator